MGNLTAQVELTAITGDELFYVVDGDATTPVPRKITIENLASGLADRVEMTNKFAQAGASTVSTRTAAYTAVARDLILASAATAAFTVTLPAVTAGRWVTVKKTDSTANAVTVSPASGTIDGASTHVIATQYASRDFVSDGTNWFVV